MTIAFVFRRDFRLHDNLALMELEKVGKVNKWYFFLHSNVVGNKKWASKVAVDFMLELLKDLGKQVPLKIVKVDSYKDEVKYLSKCSHVGFNSDITPYARERDEWLTKELDERGVKVITASDYTLFPIGDYDKKYVKFTPFYKYYSAKFKGVKCRNDIAEKLLGNINNWKNYAQTRDNPSVDTTQMSKWIKFGVISCREAASLFRPVEGLFRQIFWRDFYYHVAWNHPGVLRGEAMNGREAKWVSGDEEKKRFKAWSEGKTGVPFVDAGMRQLLATGWMHNRLRLVTASYLIKDLHVNWRLGEQWFARHLVDYDPAVNNGNWQWVAGTGTDSMPYYRIFNPWTQSKKFDPNGTYIRQWVPELGDMDSAELHVEDNFSSKVFIDHASAAKYAKNMWN